VQWFFIVNIDVKVGGKDVCDYPGDLIFFKVCKEMHSHRDMNCIGDREVTNVSG